MLSRKKVIPLHGLKKGLFVRFSPGRFSDIFSIPAYEILPEGMDIRDVFSAVQIGQLRDAVCLNEKGKEAQEAVLSLLLGWDEGTEKQDCFSDSAPDLGKKRQHKNEGIGIRDSLYGTPHSGTDYRVCWN